GFIYPGLRKRFPDWIIQKLVQKLLAVRKKPPSANHSFKGTLLSREQYLIDLDLWGYPDARLKPDGFMNSREIALWTEAIGKDSCQLVFAISGFDSSVRVRNTAASR